MAIRFVCPSGHCLAVADHYAGSNIRCGRCGKILRVPVPPGAVRRGPAKAARPPRRPARKQTPPSVPVPRIPRAAEPVTREAGDLMARTGDRRERSASTGASALPRNVHVAGPRQVARVYRLAAILAVAVVLSMAPVVWLGHFDLGAAPAWACAVLLTAALQAFYLVWMVNAPDWATAWVVMLVFALVAAGYAVAMAAAMTTPVDHPLLLGMSKVRYSAAPWCGAMVVVMGLGTWLSGRLSSQWRRRAQAA